MNDLADCIDHKFNDGNYPELKYLDEMLKDMPKFIRLVNSLNSLDSYEDYENFPELILLTKRMSMISVSLSSLITIKLYSLSELEILEEGAFENKFVKLIYNLSNCFDVLHQTLYMNNQKSDSFDTYLLYGILGKPNINITNQIKRTFDLISDSNILVEMNRIFNYI